MHQNIVVTDINICLAKEYSTLQFAHKMFIAMINNKCNIKGSRNFDLGENRIVDFNIPTQFKFFKDQQINLDTSKILPISDYLIYLVANTLFQFHCCVKKGFK